MKVCILICDDSKAWKPLDFGDMFMKCLLNNEKIRGTEVKFHKCCCAAGDPITELVKNYDRFVISGSRFNVRDGVEGKLEWFEPLCDLVKEVVNNPKKRLFGCCFGHQLIAHALGGKVDFNPHDDGEFILLAETLNWNEKAMNDVLKDKCCCAESCSVILEKASAGPLKVLCSHGDSVIERPAHSTLIASSGSCTNEVIVYGSYNNVMSCQGHPEFEYEYAIKERIWPAVVDKNKRLSEPKVRQALESFKGFNRDCGPNQLSYLIAEFLELHKSAG